MSNVEDPFILDTISEVLNFPRSQLLHKYVKFKGQPTISSLRKINKLTNEDIAKKSIDAGDIRMVKILLKNGTIDVEKLNQICRTRYEISDCVILKELHNHNYCIWGKDLIAAMRHDREDTIEYILSNIKGWRIFSVI